MARHGQQRREPGRRSEMLGRLCEVACLSGRQRQAMVLAVEGADGQAIACEMQIGQSAVSRLLTRARERLKVTCRTADPRAIRAACWILEQMRNRKNYEWQYDPLAQFASGGDGAPRLRHAELVIADDMVEWVEEWVEVRDTREQRRGLTSFGG